MPSVTAVVVSLCSAKTEGAHTDEDGLDAIQSIVLGDLILLIKGLHSDLEAIPQVGGCVWMKRFNSGQESLLPRLGGLRQGTDNLKVGQK
jgi:hypothetical protein